MGTRIDIKWNAKTLFNQSIVYGIDDLEVKFQKFPSLQTSVKETTIFNKKFLI